MPSTPRGTSMSPAVPPWLKDVVMPILLLLLSGVVTWGTLAVQTSLNSQREMQGQFAAMDKRLALLEQQTLRMIPILDTIDRRQGSTDTRLSVIEQRLESRTPAR